MANIDPKTGKNKGGRPEGAMSKLSREAREAARLTGMLPHEILLDIARGNVQTVYLPDEATGVPIAKKVAVDLETRLEAAKASAPYYAPKISTVELISGVSEDDLDAIIARAASEAGVSLGSGGEGQEGDEAPAVRQRVQLQP